LARRRPVSPTPRRGISLSGRYSATLEGFLRSGAAGGGGVGEGPGLEGYHLERGGGGRGIQPYDPLMSQVESAWPRHPEYRIDISAFPHPVRVVYRDLPLAESRHALLVDEIRHKPVLYLPERDVRRALFRNSEHHTVCPFKGEASYWTLDAEGMLEENVLWYYPDPFPEVADIRGHVAFYDDRVSVEVDRSEPIPGLVGA
jgi:uncharacterized protein (DUF427 family)